MIYLSQRLPSTGSPGTGGGGVVSTNAAISYEDRGDLRTLTGTTGDLSIVEGLGIYQYYTATEQLDDDETCFRNGVGGWVLVVSGWDRIYSILGAEIESAGQATRLTNIPLPSATLVSGASLSFTVTDYNKMGMVVFAAVVGSSSIDITGDVISSSEIEFTVTNNKSSSQSITGIEVQYFLIKGTYAV